MTGTRPARATRRRTAAGTLVALGLSLGAGLVLPLLAAGPAGASDQAAGTAGRIAHVEAADGQLQILVDAPAGAQVDLADPRVTVEGEPVEATASQVDDATPVRRTAVIAIDLSNSMRGERFIAAKTAARRFVASVPDDVYVGMVGFASDVRTLLAPTQDRTAAQGVIAGLGVDPGTSLYDGVAAATELAGDDGQRTVLVISDGADTTDTPLADVVSTVEASGTTVDVVALDQGGATVPGLQELATAGGGQVLPADPAALRQAFADEAALLADQVLVTATLPASAAGRSEGDVEVTLSTTAGPVVARALAPLAGAEPAPVPVATSTASAGGLGLPSWVVYVGPLLLGVGLLAIALTFVPPKVAPMGAAERVTTYTGRQARHAAAAARGGRSDTEQALTQAKDVAADLLERNKGLEVRISKRLDGAGSELRSAEWVLVHGGLFVISGLVGLLVSRGNVVVGLVFMALGAVGPWFYLGFRRNRRRRSFERGLPDTLQLMSGSLSAGLSLAQAVDTIVREGPDPIAGEFKRVLVETRLGVSLEDAMDGVSERFESKDFEWVVMAIRIQRQVGGNLAELLDTVAATMREREYIRRQVAALAAEGKLSAYVLGGLPPAFLLYLLVGNRDYVMVMFTNPIGWAMLAGAAVILSVGVFWMSRLVKVKV